jgi:hypothetical protein
MVDVDNNRVPVSEIELDCANRQWSEQRLRRIVGLHKVIEPLVLHQYTNVLEVEREVFGARGATGVAESDGYVEGAGGLVREDEVVDAFADFCVKMLVHRDRTRDIR